MKYQWNGDTKLCLPGRVIRSGDFFEPTEYEVSMSGFRKLEADGLLVRQQDITDVPEKLIYNIQAASSAYPKGEKREGDMEANAEAPTEEHYTITSTPEVEGAGLTHEILEPLEDNITSPETKGPETPAPSNPERTVKGVLEHKHGEHNYWHPAARIHQEDEEN